MGRRLAHEIAELRDRRVSRDAAQVEERAVVPRVFRALPLDDGSISLV
jgi:hypothetical protein